MHDEIVNRCFARESKPNTQFYLEADHRELAIHSRSPQIALSQGGLYKYVHDGEYHCYNPDVISTLQQAVKSSFLLRHT